MKRKRQFSINYVPWNELQTYRCTVAETTRDCRVHHGHSWTLGGNAFFVPLSDQDKYITLALTEAYKYLKERGFSV